MTHVKNVEAFTRLIGFCTGYGGKYNPVRPNLQVSMLNATLAQAQQAMRDEKLARNTYNNVINARMITFGELPKLASRVVSLLASAGASPQALADAKVFQHRTFGGPPKTTTTSPMDAAGAPLVVKTKTLRQRGYAAMADNFEKLVSLAGTLPEYQANEADLKLEALQAKVTELHAMNDAVIAARVSWSNGLINRNEALYAADDALYVSGKQTREYVKALFGPDSVQYDQVKNIVFTKPI